MNILEFNHVVKRYAAHTALDDVSYQIPEGCIFGLLGPNGAGKTTSIRIITQIIAPDEGTVKFQGKLLSESDNNSIGYLPEERGLYKKMNIADQVIYLAQLKGVSKADATARCKQWFERFELQSWWNKKVGDLSKGMQQKVQFIATVIHEPKLVILDEPFTGFDPINAQILKEEILRLKQLGTTVIFSTHRMESVEQLCDHLVMINKSKVVLSGETKEVQNRFKQDTFKLIFTGTTPDWMQGSTITQNGDVHEVILQGAGNMNDVLQRAIQSGLMIHGCNEIIPSMNDIFINTIRGNGHE